MKKVQKEIFDDRKEEERLLAFDFFCGCGGFSLGLILAGFEVIGAMDNDYNAAIVYLMNLGDEQPIFHFTSEKYREQMEKNLTKAMKKTGIPLKAASGWRASEWEKGNWYPGVKHFFFGDITEVSGYWILEEMGLYPGELDLIVGGPPCQGFSKANRKANANDVRNKLVMEFAEKIRQMNPKTFVMENVPAILKHKLTCGKNYVEKFCDFIESSPAERTKLTKQTTD